MSKNFRKNIGVFVNKLDDYFQKNVYKYIIQASLKYGYNVLIFNSYGNDNPENKFDNLEGLIVEFAPLENLDGVIVVPDSYSNPDTKERLLNRIKEKCTCPVVALRTKNPDFYNVIIDETMAMRDMVRHFIYHHKFTKIAFLGGIREHYDARMRYQCYIEEMEKAGIPINPNFIYHGNFWYTCGEAACDYFLKDPDDIPEAVICANDFMAVALSSALQKRGYSIPQDICISGFDDTSASRAFDPLISTIGVNIAEMATKSVEIIHACIEGQTPEQRVFYTATIPHFRGSCGCNADTHENTQKIDTEAMERSATMINRQVEYTLYAVSMGGCASINDITTVIHNHIPATVINYQDFYLCLFDEDKIDCTNYPIDPPKESTLTMAIQDNKSISVESDHFKTSQILPEYAWKEDPQILYITMLHNQDKFFGYTVISFMNNKSFDIFYHSFNVSLAMTLNDVYTKRKNKQLMEMIERQSITDPLTGIFNRRGYKQNVQELWRKYMQRNGYGAFISLDLDHLKLINDTFGHSGGDFAICSIANAMQYAKEDPDTICSRTGGDEYVTVLFSEDKDQLQKAVDQYILRLNEKLAMINDTSDKGFQIRTSIGVNISKLSEISSHEECLRLSDLELYKNKRAHKKNE